MDDGGNADFGSLFDGMDFVTHVPSEGESSRGTEDTKSQTNPLRDDELFLEYPSLALGTSSTMSLHHVEDRKTVSTSTDNSACFGSAAGTDLLQNKQSEIPSESLSSPPGSRERIMAAYDNVAEKPFTSSFSAVTSTPADSSILRPSIRRKKRGLKIGYGRGGDDSEEGVQIKGGVLGRTTMATPEVHASQHDSSFFSNLSSSDEKLICVDVITSLAGDRSLNEPLDSEQVQTGNCNPSAETGTYEPSKTNEKLPKTDLNFPVQYGTHIADSCQELQKGFSEDFLAAETGDDSSDMKSVLSEIRNSEDVTDDNCEAIIDDEIGLTRSVFSQGDAFVDGGGAEAATVSSDVTEMMTNALEKCACDKNVDEALDLSWNLPTESTFEERLDFIKSSLAKNLEGLQQKVANLSQARKVTSQKRRQAADKLSNTSAKFKELEAELEVACEREDFEKAESLSEDLSATERARETASEAFRAIEIECDSTASKMLEVLKLQAALEEKGAKLLRQLGQAAAVLAEQTQKEAEQRADRDLKTWETEEEAVKSRKMNVLVELKAVEAANCEISNIIDDSIQAELEEKLLLIKKRQILLEDLESLLQMVKEKEADIAEHDKNIKDVEERIDNICAGFEKERLRLKEDYEGVVSTYRSLENESEYLMTRKEEVEAGLRHAQEEKRKLERFVELAEKEVLMLEESLFVKKSAALAALHSREKRISLAEIERQAEEFAQALRHQASLMRTSLQELTLEKTNLHQEVTSAKQRLSFIEKRFPEIEAEKKLAAAARNFKEAGRLAAEAKSLLADKDAVISELKRTMLELQKFEQEVESQMCSLSDIEVLIAEKGKETAMARCERLRLLAAATRNERDVARELEDFDEADSLDTEAEAADNEADQLQRMHGFEGEQFEKSNFKMEPKLAGMSLQSFNAEKRTQHDDGSSRPEAG